jgi:hypothetical protein
MKSRPPCDAAVDKPMRLTAGCLGMVVGLLAGAIAGGVGGYGLVLVEESTRKTGPGPMYFGAELLLPFLIAGGAITDAIFGFWIARKAWTDAAASE